MNGLKPVSAQTLILARDYAATMKKPFPEINDKILEERDWPKDFYVFEGKGKGPTIVYMPLFNRNNCKGLLRPRSQHKKNHVYHVMIANSSLLVQISRRSKQG